MAEVIGVRFREVGKIYTFHPAGMSFRRGDHVIVETNRGREFATVVLGNYQICEGQLKQPLCAVLRRAEAEDEERVRLLREKEGKALKICREKVLARRMEMKIIAAEYAFDENKLLFFFTADGRVDFRELVKDLASAFHMRIELRQVGVRDETRIIGGMGPCGRPLCCHSWLSDFVPVSIKMAKEQNLSLNPQKISGVCGRLMCCLKNEADTYAYLNARLPKKGDIVALSGGEKGEIIDVNVLKQSVRVLVILDNDEREIREASAESVELIAHRKKGQPSQMKKDAMARREAVMQEARERLKKKRNVSCEEEAGEGGEGAQGRRDAMGGRKRRPRGQRNADPELCPSGGQRPGAARGLPMRPPGEGGRRFGASGGAEGKDAFSGQEPGRPRRRRRRRPDGEAQGGRAGSVRTEEKGADD